MYKLYIRYHLRFEWYLLYMYYIVAVAEIQDHETGLVSEPFSWFQSRQIFCETHETEANPIHSFNLFLTSKNETSNSIIHQFMNSKSCKMSLK